MELEDRAGASSDFGTLLRRHRIAAGLSQEALAELARMSSDGISALERGHRRTPQRETIALLAGALALSAGQRREFEAAAVPPSATRRGARVTVGPWPNGAAADPPLSLSGFIGRENELAEIAALVRERRLVTLTGAGGVGKTQTALRVASALSDTVDDGVRFVALAPVGDPAHVVRAIALALGVQHVPNRPVLETVSAYLKNRTMLLVIDNCEHVIAEVANTAGTLLSGCPRARILATSREPMKTAGEYAYRLPSLDSSSALALFAERARAVDHRFALSDESTPFVAEICRRLDGIPLAIELAAARANVLSAKAIAEKLGDRFQLLTGGERTALARHQTMRALIDWSHDLLSPQERRLFRSVAIFVRSWTFEAAETVCTDEMLDARDVLDLLSSLVQKSLVVVEMREAPRYRLLESIRAFALDKIEQSEREALARRHALWAAGLGDRAHDAGKTESLSSWFSEFEPDLENARCAIGWALAHSEIVVAARIVVGFSRAYRQLGAEAELRSWLQAVLDRIDPASHPELAAWAFLDLSYLTVGSGVVEAAKRGVELSRCCKDPAISVLGLAGLAHGLIEVGRSSEAQATLEQALRLLKEPGLSRFPTVRVNALTRIADTARLCGRFDEARRAFNESLALVTELGDEPSMAGRRLDLAELEFAVGNVAAALDLVQLVESEAHNLPDMCLIFALANGAGYRIALGELTEARLAAREALQLARGAYPFPVINAIQHLAAAAAALGADPRCSARLRGYVDALFCSGGAVRQPTEQHSDDILMAVLRQKLTASEIESLAAEGARLSEDKAVAEALAL
jgi:predicted ATPase/DNA-binding XRE family transcriptional regulator